MRIAHCHTRDGRLLTPDWRFSWRSKPCGPEPAPAPFSAKTLKERIDAVFGQDRIAVMVLWAVIGPRSFAAEYRHSDFGRVSGTIVIQIPDGIGTTFAVGSTAVGVTVDQVTARANYRFAPR